MNTIKNTTPHKLLRKNIIHIFQFISNEYTSKIIYSVIAIYIMAYVITNLILLCSNVPYNISNHLLNCYDINTKHYKDCIIFIINLLFQFVATNGASLIHC